MPKNKEVTVKVTGVSLQPLDVKIVREFANSRGFGPMGFSSALRFIIREWAEMKAKENSKESQPR